jgi:hypothetical protein
VRTCSCCTSFFQTDLGGGGSPASCLASVSIFLYREESAQPSWFVVPSLSIPTTCCHKLITFVPMGTRCTATDYDVQQVEYDKRLSCEVIRLHCYGC